MVLAVGVCARALTASRHLQSLITCGRRSMSGCGTSSLLRSRDDSVVRWHARQCHHVARGGLPALLERAPDFSGTAVVDGAFREISLSDYRGRYLVLFFYPLDFTFVCPTELVAFSDRIAEFQSLNTAVVGVSCDSQYSHLAWIDLPRREGGLGGLKYPLLADFNKQVARSYGVLLEKEGVALRGLFLIDPNGVLRQLSVNDLPVGRSVDETLRLVQAFQFYEQHGEVCPANWTPGAATIKPDPEQSREYFDKVN